MWPNPQFPAALVTLTEEILIGKLHLLCSGFGWSCSTFAINISLNQLINISPSPSFGYFKLRTISNSIYNKAKTAIYWKENTNSKLLIKMVSITFCDPSYINHEMEMQILKWRFFCLSIKWWYFRYWPRTINQL